jgi:hypothetical protein
MSNVTWACFECRETVRRPGYTRAAVLCPTCGEPCRYLGHKLRTPPKRQAKAWRELLTEVQQQAVACAEPRQQLRLRQVREIQTEIARLEAKGPNEGRAKQVRSLRRQLAKL